MGRKIEAACERGRREALVKMLREITRALGIEDPETGKAGWIIEREETIACLRRACERFGDNEWTERLNLADVIEKHLVRYLEEA